MLTQLPRYAHSQSFSHLLYLVLMSLQTSYSMSQELPTTCVSTFQLETGWIRTDTLVSALLKNGIHPQHDKTSSTRGDRHSPPIIFIQPTSQIATDCILLMVLEALNTMLVLSELVTPPLTPFCLAHLSLSKPLVFSCASRVSRWLGSSESPDLPSIRLSPPLLWIILSSGFACNHEPLLTILPTDSYVCHLDNLIQDGILSFHDFIFYIVRLLPRNDTLTSTPRLH